MKKDLHSFCFVMLLVLTSSKAISQTFGEAFGVNSGKDNLPTVQNDYPTVREYHLWAGDQGYPTTSTQIGYPILNFDFTETDVYYSQRRSGIINTAFGIPGEMRGLKESDFQNGEGLKWFVKKPFVPFNYRQSAPTGTDGGIGFLLTEPMIANPNLYYGDWFNNINFPQDNPATWRDKARWMTLLAERYGDASLMRGSSNSFIIDDYERLYDGQVIGRSNSKSPVIFFEAENEPDRGWWEPSAAEATAAGFVAPVQNSPRTMWQTSPQFLAAQTSMLYDGHGKSPASIFPPANIVPAGENGFFHLGVKNVGPNNKVAIAGLAGLRGKYIEEMLDWFISNRVDGVHGFNGNSGAPVMPFEAISFHHYAAASSKSEEIEYNYDEGQWDVNSGEGINPELHRLRPRLTYFLDRLEEAFDERGYWTKWQDTEVWLSEFGYDSNNKAPGDPVGGGLVASGGIQVPFIQNVNGSPGEMLNRELVQAQWLSRSYLEIMATRGDDGHRIDRFMQYELVDLSDTDVNGPAGQHFQTCGLYRLNGIPKPSHFFTQIMLKQLKDFDHEFSLTGEYLNFPSSISDALIYSSATNSNGNIPFTPSSVSLMTLQSEDTYTLPIAYRYNRKYGNTADQRLVVWSPTGGSFIDDPNNPGTSIRVGGYQYDIDLDVAAAFSAPLSNGAKITMIELVDGSTIGRPTELTVANGKVTIPVSETPIILQPGSLGSTTIVSTIDEISVEDYCCGNLEISWSRVSRTLRNRVDVYYIPASQVPPSNLVPFRDLIPVVEDYAGTQLNLPQLTPGVSYYIVLLPTNRFGYGIDISAGVDMSPSANLAHLVVPDVCTDGSGQECVTAIPATAIDVISGFVPSSALSTVFSGGQDLDGDGLSCSIPDPFSVQPQWGANGQGTFSAEVTFDPPIDIQRIQLVFGGVGTINPSFTIEVQTCECPKWESYANVIPQPGGSEQLIRRKSRVTKMRLQNTEANLAAMLLCSSPSACKPKIYEEELSVETSAVAKTRATITWTPAFDTSGQQEAEGYQIKLAKGLTAYGDLLNPIEITIETNHGGSLSHDLLDLQPNQLYYGRVIPVTPCLEIEPTLFPRPYLESDSTYFSFSTLPEEKTKGRQQQTQNTEAQSSIEASSLREVSEVYPNPTSGEVHISAPDQLISITIRDVQGRMLGHFTDFSSREATLNLSEFQRGMLVVFVNTAFGSDTHLIKLE